MRGADRPSGRITCLGSLDRPAKRRQILTTVSVHVTTDMTFGPFTLDLASSRLLCDGAEVKLRPRAFHVLRVLLQRNGRSLGYEQLMAEAWEGTFVSRHTVDVTVREVKKTLGQYGK